MLTRSSPRSFLTLSKRGADCVWVPSIVIPETEGRVPSLPQSTAENVVVKSRQPRKRETEFENCFLPACCKWRSLSANPGQPWTSRGRSAAAVGTEVPLPQREDVGRRENRERVCVRERAVRLGCHFLHTNFKRYLLNVCRTTVLTFFKDKTFNFKL